MLVLSLVWLAGGALVGSLANMASMGPAVWWQTRRRSRWSTIGLGAVAALAGGWLGTLLLGRFFGSPTAVWVSVIVVVLVPRGVARLARRVRRA
jgi:hypothetical protein